MGSQTHGTHGAQRAHGSNGIHGYMRAIRRESKIGIRTRKTGHASVVEPVNETDCTRKTGHESIFEPVSETETGGTSRNDSCHEN